MSLLSANCKEASAKKKERKIKKQHRDENDTK